MEKLDYGLSRRATMLGFGAVFAGSFALRAQATQISYDIVIYGATPGGIVAAQTAAQHGQRVALVVGFSRFGGMMAGGLSHSDLAHPNLIGGNALNFFKQIGKRYGSHDPVYAFEPHVANSVFIEILQSLDIDVFDSRLLESVGVLMTGSKIAAIKLENGTLLRASQFIDASYEGDLMAHAGVQYVVGRESVATYGEALAGFNQFPTVGNISPRDSNGNLYFGVLPQSAVLLKGSADKSVQAYGYRLCLSNDPSNMVPFAKPPGYDVNHIHIDRQQFIQVPVFHPTALPNSKFDLNSNGIVGGSLNYPDANYVTRTQIAAAHKRYQQALLWMQGTDPSVLPSMRELVRSYGLAKDEFTDSGNWPDGALYLREGRRMVGEYVFRQQDTQTSIVKSDPIARGGWFVDCHPCGYYEYDGKLLVEGFLDTVDTHGRADTEIFDIPYGILVPKASQATNLWVTCCTSASHIGYEPIRIEWIYMTLGEAAATAAVIANLSKFTAQTVPYTALAAVLKSNGSII